MEKAHAPGQRTLATSGAFDPIASSGMNRTLKKTLSEGAVKLTEPFSEKAVSGKPGYGM